MGLLELGQKALKNQLEALLNADSQATDQRF